MAQFVIKRVGVVGLGHMGHAFAVNLVEDGHQVSVYDRDKERIAPLLPSGIRGAERLADLADCDVVLTSLPDDDALSAVALGPAGLAGIIAPNAAHISTSTVSPTVSRRVAEAHASQSQDYVAAPVLGNPDFARERKLFVLAAGLPSAMQKIRRLLERLGQRVFVIGEEPACTTDSSEWWRAAGPGLTGRPSVCSRPLMRGSMTVEPPHRHIRKGVPQ